MVETNEHISAAVQTAPYSPSPVEAQYYYYGIPSQPRLVARSDTNAWLEPKGAEAYLLPKECSPLGLHPLQKIWEGMVGPAMDEYLVSKGVEYTSLDPVRMGYAGDSSPSAIVWIGVLLRSLSAEVGVEVATHCKGILSAHGIDDVHVEIRESEVFRSAKMYKPVPTSNATVRAREPFSTALGLPICAEVTPSIEGTGGFFISDPRNPGKIYLVTARHVVFHPDKEPNELYEYHNSGQPRRNVLLFGDTAIKKRVKAIESEIGGNHIIIEHLKGRLENAEQMDAEDAEAEQKQVLLHLEAQKAIGDLEKFHAAISRDWKEQENRILGYVVLSPPIGFGVGEEEFTEDWAVIEIDDSKIDSANFVGNVIDLGTTIPVDKFTTWISPISPPSFKYPGNRLLKLHGIISDEEMWNPNSKNLDHDNDPCIMVLKRGNASDLTVGRLNTVRSFTRVYSNGKPGKVSKELAVLPRNSKSGAFSRRGDSGSVVADSKGRYVGLLTGGAGTKVSDSDCTYLTSINFLVKRMSEHGLEADLFPSLKA
ncbi:hypothetical protein VNI00_006942 [Paramarasmius palmivorus]|uniref:Uncharacterized protein n=1 Tax=Paramarasmius palmivorus TaxID=297713 RepID=A0AAW0D4D4_9AGAR